MTKVKWFLNSSNQEMCEWAYVYLCGRDYRLQLGSRSHYDACITLLNNLFPDTAKLLERDMRAAWRQRKYVDKQIANGKKPSSFILSEISLGNLANLAGELGMPINATLEKIIQQAHTKYEYKKKVLQKKASESAAAKKTFSRLKAKPKNASGVNQIISIPKGIPEE